MNDPGGFLGTDTGGKVATLRAMTERGDAEPDLGYWGERWDPAGLAHPITFTERTDQGWVTVTTIPALLAALPLYRLGGYRATLLLPMLGSLLAALAARALVRRLRPGDDGRAWLAFWLTGLASPLAIYALDFWEHSLGVAAVAWGVVLAVDALAIAGRAQGARMVAAGVLFGVAASMRTEALVYAAVVVAVAGVVVARERSAARGAVAGVLLAVGLAAPLAANHLLERAVLGEPLRASRAAATAQATGETPGARAEEALVTTVSVGDGTGGIPLGLAVVAALGAASVRGGRELAPSARRAAVVAMGAAALGLALRMAAGPSFVPGLLVAAPIACAAWRAVRRPAASAPSAGAVALRARPGVVAAIALLAVPLVLASQYVGGAGPQWGGRYLLTTGLLLMALGVAVLDDLVRPVRAAFVGLAVAVTAFGLAWLSVRSHDVARTAAALDGRPEPVVVSRVPHLGREAGASYGRKRWLTVAGREAAPAAGAVLAGARVPAFVLVEDASAPRTPSAWFPGYRRSPAGMLRLFDGVTLRLSRWTSVRSTEQTFGG